MTLLVSVLAFFFLITGLVIIHELGHFLAARKAGVEVEEFGFGLPPRAGKLFSWRGTAFTLNWIPFGGFVRLKGEGTTDDRDAPGSFSRASILARCIVLIAGVAMNFILAFVIFLYGFSGGKWIPTYLTLEEMEDANARGEIQMQLAVLIDDVLAGGGASDAGISKNTILLSVDGTPVIHTEDVMRLQEGKRRVAYAYRDAQDATDTPVQTVSVSVQDGKTGVYLRSVPLNVAAPSRSIAQSFMISLRETKVVTTQTVIGIAKLFTSLARHAEVPEGVTGIVGIAQLTYSSVSQGFEVYLRLVALLSLSLAVLNILPFPALDGGRLLFVLSELFIKPGNRRVEIITNTVGFGVLLFVILLVTFYDVFRLFV